MTKKTVKKKAKAKPRKKCGLCGESEKIIKTPCCGQLICDDYDKYVLFSYAHNSCSRNHSRYTLCGFHHSEEHEGDWKECPICRDSFETEMYVWYGTNEYNFEKLPDPPAYEPTNCSSCGKVIVLAEDGCSMLGDDYWCEECAEKRWNK